MNFGYGVGDTMAVSRLALKVYTAYKDAPGDYRNISDEVESLHIIIKKAAQHFESTTLSDNSRQEGQKVLKGCKNVLEDLDTLIEKYNNLASSSTSPSTRQVLQRFKLGASQVFGTEDIATLRARLTSNITLLNGFIQSCESDKIQARLDSVLGLRRTMSRDSILSFAGSINTKKAYKKFCKCLFSIGVTAEMIGQKEREIQDIFRPQHHLSASNQIGSCTFVGLTQLPGVGNSSNTEMSSIFPNTETSPISPISPENQRSQFWSGPGWVQPPIDFLVGPSMLIAAEAGNTKELISALEYIRDINFADDHRKETALHKAAAKGHQDMVQLLLSQGASTEVMNSFNNTPLDLAARNGYTNIMELLLMNGASGESMGGDPSALLHCATSSGHTRTVELLLSKGAPIEAMDKSRRTPLHLAAWHGHTRTVALLLAKGASTEATDEAKWTPLHLAAWYGRTLTVELLLLKGASTEATDSLNKTPLDLAKSKRYPGIAKLLKNKSAQRVSPTNIRTISV